MVAFSLAALLLFAGTGRADATVPHVTVIADSVGGILRSDGASNSILTGGRALATFLHPFVVYACGAACVPPTAYCGLSRTVNGFDYVQGTGLGCAAARVITAEIERNNRGPWTCARNVGGQIELTCTHADEKIELLERSPVPATVGPGGVVTLSNWSFRLHGAVLQGRQDALGWLSLGRAPWCIPGVPREALLALPLKSLTPDGGCFGPR